MKSLLVCVGILFVVCVVTSQETVHSNVPIVKGPLKLPDKKYHIGNYFKTDWFNAYRYCRSIKMKLASVPTELAYEHMKELIHAHGLERENFWVSGTGLGAKDNEFYWMSNGQPFTFTAWADGEPNHSDDTNGAECVALWGTFDLKWNDVNCSFDNAYFVCEK